MFGAAAAVICFFAWTTLTRPTVEIVSAENERSQIVEELGDDDGFDSEVADPSYDPRQVVELQLESLQNAITDPDQMRVCYSLASPANRALTGPLSRFVGLFRGQEYRPLLGHQSSMIGKVRVDGDQADMMVSVIAEDGQAYAYQFLLSRQAPVDALPSLGEVDAIGEIEPSDGVVDVDSINDSEKCWLTHSVFPLVVGKIVPTRTTEN